MEKAGRALAAVGPGLLVVAASPWLAACVLAGFAFNYAVGYFFAPFAAVQALVSPARERSLAFSLGAIFLVLGVIGFFLLGLGSISDDHGIRWALAVLAPFWIAGGLLARTAGTFVAEDTQRALNRDYDRSHDETGN
jgi:hypothetical protein